MSIAKRQIKSGLILHSDSGVQNRSGDYQRALLNNGIPSMDIKTLRNTNKLFTRSTRSNLSTSCG